MMEKQALAEKRQREKEVVGLMIEVYCHGKHGSPKGSLCPTCAALRDYAWLRSDKCPFMEKKTFCSNCTVHCYRPEMREQIRQVMRYSGPRMLKYHPILALRHVLESRKEKKRLAAAAKAGQGQKP